MDLHLCCVTKLGAGWWSSSSILFKYNADSESRMQVYLFLVIRSSCPFLQQKVETVAKKIQLSVRESKESNDRYWKINNSMISEDSQWQCRYLVYWYWHSFLFLNSSKILETLPRHPFPGHSFLLQLRSFLTSVVDQPNCFLTSSLWIRKIILVVSGLLCFPSKYTVS